LKKLIIPLAVLLVIAFVITGCAGGTSTTPANTSPEPTSTSPTSTGNTPVYGGVLRIITSQGPQSLSYIPEMGPSDSGAVFPAVERLMDATKDRSMGNGLEPVLCSSVDDDVANKRIVFHIRPGVKFHDGSDLNADVVIWNFKLMEDAGKIQYSTYYKGVKKIDDMTVELDYTEYTNQLIQAWAWTAIYSKAAYDKVTNNGANPDAYKDWARKNVVGTGPFMLKEWVRDDHITWVKNPNYWRPGQPYLDGIEVRYIPDSVTAKNMMLAKEADFWDSPTAKDLNELESKGFLKVGSWPGMPQSIWPNTADPNSKWNDKRLRMAIEYAIDKPTLAKTLGYGNYVPMTMLAPPGEWGYDPNYPARNYDPAKARQLLLEAGYPNGLKAKLLITNAPASLDAGTAIKQYLDAAGFNIELDVADLGRFYGTVWGNHIPDGDLVLMWSGMDITQLVTYMRWFSTDPFTNVSFLGHTPEQAALDKEAQAIPDVPGQKQIIEKIIKYMTDECRVVPLYLVPSYVIVQPYVHTDRFSQGFIRWQTENTWMEKH